MAQILKTHIKPLSNHFRHLLGPFGAISTDFGGSKKKVKKNLPEVTLIYYLCSFIPKEGWAGLVPAKPSFACLYDNNQDLNTPFSVMRLIHSVGKPCSEELDAIVTNFIMVHLHHRMEDIFDFVRDSSLWGLFSIVTVYQTIQLGQKQFNLIK